MYLSILASIIIYLFIVKVFQIVFKIQKYQGGGVEVPYYTYRYNPMSILKNSNIFLYCNRSKVISQSYIVAKKPYVVPE